MVKDLTEKIQSSQGKLEQLASRIPGVGKYRQKEQRREADRLLRTHIGRELEAQAKRLATLQQTMVNRGQLQANLALERASGRLQNLIDRIKTASYGYAGFFDAIKVDEDVLDRLYEFDERMLEAVEELGATITQIEEAVQAGEASEATESLVQHLEALHATFSQRQELILG